MERITREHGIVSFLGPSSALYHKKRDKENERNTFTLSLSLLYIILINAKKTK